MGKISILSNEVINQIAAGEIVERPSSALKEIIENSIDAGSKNIEIFLKNGGKSKIVVEDDGEGLDKDDLLICIQRHATSKLKGSNLFEIGSYGFRGEALPSIASISNFSIESKGFGISVNFSEVSEIFHSKIDNITRVKIENIFDSLPARLKFLKSDNFELSSCISIIENFALNRKDINFTLNSEKGNLLLLKNDNFEERVSKILGKDLFKKAIFFKEDDENISISGYLFHPIDSKYSQNFQRIFVNGRIVKDKIISNSIKNAYKDLIPSGRFAVALLFIEINPFYVDVNVSPTKSEIRFRDSSYTQKMITESIRKNLSKFDRVIIDFDFSKTIDFKKNTILKKDSDSLNNLDFKNNSDSINNLDSTNSIHFKNDSNLTNFSDLKKSRQEYQNKSENEYQNEYQKIPQKSSYESYLDGSLALDINTLKNTDIFDNTEIKKNTIIIEEENIESFFGEPICQLFDTYIISQKKDSIIIIDQHAVNEKITQEKIIKNLNLKNRQYLLRPEIIEISNQEKENAKLIIDILKECGFNVELVQDSLIVYTVPSSIDKEISIQFINDILESEDIITTNELNILDFIKAKIADKACHNSIRAGRKLTNEEMKAIIKDMENTKSIHQCNHHRPSFLSISKKDLENMFQRK